MGDWISDLLIFSAGVTGGILVTLIKPYFSMPKRQRTALVAARTRILNDIKHKHEEEILDEAFRATQAIRGELDKSLRHLSKTLDTVLAPVDPPRNGQQVVHLTDPIKSGESS
jgi:hypothetical protein